jgi:hypothetical protein
MNEQVKILLTDLHSALAPYVQTFEDLNQEFRQVKNYNISIQLDSVSSNAHNLQAMIEKLIDDLEKGIPEKDRFPFMNPYVD